MVIKKLSDNFDFSEFDIFDSKKSDNNKKQQIECSMFRTNTNHFHRRAKSEVILLDLLDKEIFIENESYHFISFGDVDSLSFVKAITRKQQIDYLLFSTWCIGRADIMDIEYMLENKIIKKIDGYFGEIIKNSYFEEYNLLKKIIEKYNGRVAIFRNHSKVFAGFGEKFNFVIESSANINTNPRTEQTTITISTELANFYKDFYDKIISFDK